jgi:hypothetical protein
MSIIVYSQNWLTPISSGFSRKDSAFFRKDNFYTFFEGKGFAADNAGLPGQLKIEKASD